MGADCGASLRGGWRREGLGVKGGGEACARSGEREGQNPTLNSLPVVLPLPLAASGATTGRDYRVNCCNEVPLARDLEIIV
ncbi:hypothetical protein KM043_016516 [Ampulex compressa]|nr:hypothetical protein KM043_016516 [Ampulex compressa]